VRNDYDMVLFDTPALCSVGDGAIIASKVDATLLAVKVGLTTLTSLERVKEQLEKLNVKKRDYKIHFRSYNYFFNSNRFLKNRKVKNLDLHRGHTSQM